jgi:release factor glutamine methyltransferase
VSDAGHLLASATARLRRAGVATPRVDAELLLAFVLGMERRRLLLVDTVGGDAEDRFAELVSARSRRVPLQHLTGLAPFRHAQLRVGPGVFVPRPETELLVDRALPQLRSCERPVVVDLCAGSGALAVAVAQEVPPARVIAVECAPAALTWLRANAEPAGVEVVVGDVADPQLLSGLRGGVDAVLSNPPYVPGGIEVDPEVRADPPEAVFAGPDGLDVIPSVLLRAAELLRAGGIAVVEHDDTHGLAVPALFRADRRWAEVSDHRDLTGRSRYTAARRTAVAESG